MEEITLLKEAAIKQRGVEILSVDSTYRSEWYISVGLVLKTVFPACTWTLAHLAASPCCMHLIMQRDSSVL
jgi:hypothetical protein